MVHDCTSPCSKLCGGTKPTGTQSMYNEHRTNMQIQQVYIYMHVFEIDKDTLFNCLIHYSCSGPLGGKELGVGG